MKSLISLLALFVVSVADEKCSCDPESEKEGLLYCPGNSFLMKSMVSRAPFFKDVMVASCQDMGENVYSDDEEVVTCFSEDGGLTMDCGCLDNQVIHTIKMCIQDSHAGVISLNCRSLKEPFQLGDRFDVTSADMHNVMVDCGEDAAVQRVLFSDAGDGLTTKVDFSCVSIKS